MLNIIKWQVYENRENVIADEVACEVQNIQNDEASDEILTVRRTVRNDEVANEVQNIRRNDRNDEVADEVQNIRRIVLNVPIVCLKCLVECLDNANLMLYKL